MNSKLETPNSKLTNGQLVRGLGLIAAISVNVANVIGTGVFLKARVMTCNVGAPGMALTVWLVAGLLSLAGALTYAELLAMFPRAAGESRCRAGRRLVSSHSLEFDPGDADGTAMTVAICR